MGTLLSSRAPGDRAAPGHHVEANSTAPGRRDVSVSSEFGWNPVLPTQIPVQTVPPPSRPWLSSGVMDDGNGDEAGSGRNCQGWAAAAALSKRNGNGGHLRAAQHPSASSSSGQPGGGGQGPGSPSWGHQGSGEGGRQCRPHGRCGPWHWPGTSACRSQSVVTREEGKERGTRETRGGTQGRWKTRPECHH